MGWRRPSRDLVRDLDVSAIVVTHDRAQAGRLAAERSSWTPRAAMSTVDITLAEVAASLALVAIAAAVSLWRRAELEADLGVAVLRSFLQLTAVGYVIQAIFDSDSLWVVALLLVGDGGARRLHGAAPRQGGARALGPLVLALSAARRVTIGLVLALGVFDAEARYLVPVGGMVIGNAMTAAAVALNRLADEVRGQARRLEATLALGATARQAPRALVTGSLRSAMIPLIDQTKTTGVVTFPGTMVGALAAGPSRSTRCACSSSCCGCCSEVWPWRR